jgi:hypothetical protein
MVRMTVANAALLVVMLGFCGSGTAQSTIARPKPATIRQASASEPSAAAVRDPLPPQIRVTIRYVMVDAATRDKIYAALDPKSLVTATDLPESPLRRHSEETSQQQPLQLSDQLVSSSRHQFRSPSRVTTSVLSEQQSASVIEIARASDICQVSDAPAVILIEGREAEMNDVVQHPMVVDLRSDGDSIQPTVQVFDEGLRLRMLASLGGQQRPVNGFLLGCEVSTSEIMALKTHQVFGVDNEPVPIQVPTHVVTSSTVSVRIAAGQTLLIDPHLTRTSQVGRTVGIPVLTKIPYLNRTFKNVSHENVERWMIVLLEPSMVPSSMER